MGAEVVSLIVGGTAYTAWKSMSVKYSAQSAERSFEVVAADEAPDLLSAAWIFEPGTEVELRSNGDLLVTGYINELSISIDEGNHELRVGGRSKGQDCHDCSVKHDSYEWKNKDVLGIAKDTGTEVEFTSDEKLEKIPKARANVGETVFTHLDRICRAQGLFMCGQADGSVKITKHGKQRHAGAIVEGGNMKAGDATFSDRERFKEIIVKGQLADGTGPASLHVEAWVDDEGARPGRTKIVMMDRQTDKKAAKDKAEQMKRTRQGLSVKATMTTQGFRDDGGQIWEAGWIIFCESTMLHLSQDMAIESVELTQDEGGSIARLELVDPRALGAKSAGKSRSADGWNEGL